MKSGIILIFFLLVASLNSFSLQPPETDSTQTKNYFKDTLDGKFDFSSFLVDANGFIPVPFIITEPALGSFGIGVAPLFFKQKKPNPDYEYLPPDITGAFAMYTANKSWAGFAFRQGTFVKPGIKYRIGGGYADVNLTFYRTIQENNEKKFDVNITTSPLLLYVSKRISKSDLYLGFRYTFLNTKVFSEYSDEMPDYIDDYESTNIASSVGLYADWDKRNSIFTPDRGFQLLVSYMVDDEWTGSDYCFQKSSQLALWFFTIKPNWISGLRFEGAQAFKDPPFYLLPFVNLRGIPVARYQGQQVYVAETEQRFDLNRRWSLVGFAGYGRTISDKVYLNLNENVYNYGAGFRYLIARVFNIRAGVDVAGGPDSWGWYIVFGHAWNR
jgi:hypothetical protein